MNVKLLCHTSAFGYIFSFSINAILIHDEYWMLVGFRTWNQTKEVIKVIQNGLSLASYVYVRVGDKNNHQRSVTTQDGHGSLACCCCCWQGFIQLLIIIVHMIKENKIENYLKEGISVILQHKIVIYIDMWPSWTGSGFRGVSDKCFKRYQRLRLCRKR